jgi:hypothetical protein
MTRNEHIEYWIISTGMTGICILLSIGVML